MKALAAMLVLLALTIGAAAAARAQGENRAGLVVQFGDGSVRTACIGFAEEQISGLELLERSGLPVVTQAGGIGAAVCKIGPDGCDYPAEGCFCKRDGPRTIYWAFYTLQNGGWAFSNLGAANTAVRNGDVQGWAWGLGDSGGGAQPPLVNLDALCAAPAPPPPTSAPPTAPAPTAPAPTAPAPTAPAPTAPAPTAPAPTAPAPTGVPSIPAPTVPATADSAAVPSVAAAAATSPTAATAAAASSAAATVVAPPTSAAAAGGVPASTPAEPAQDAPGGLLAFAALALVLAAGLALAARRR